jgi:hypothetical protein
MSEKKSLFYIFGLGVATGISLQSPKQAEFFVEAGENFVASTMTSITTSAASNGH